MKPSVRAMILLQVILVVYSTSNIFSKLAAGQPFMSPQFILYFGAVFLLLFVYAIGWQQVIKHMPLTTAYANKAITLVWGIVFGSIFFGEHISTLMVIGALIIMVGIVLFALEEGRIAQEEALQAEVQTQTQAQAQAQVQTQTQAQAQIQTPDSLHSEATSEVAVMPENHSSTPKLTAEERESAR